MIEALVSYIQDQGYLVAVLPGRLIIRKYVQGQLLSLSWMIVQEELKSMPKDVLFGMADAKIAELRRAEQAGPPKEQKCDSCGALLNGFGNCPNGCLTKGERWLSEK